MPRPVPVLLMSFNLGVGGSERQLAEVAKALDRTLFEPHVGCFHAEGIRADELRARGIPILQLPVTSFASFSAIRGAAQLVSYIYRHRIQLVHTFDVPLNIFGVPVARAALRTKVMSSQRAHRLLTPGAYHRLLRITDHLVDGIVVNCEYMRRHLIDDERVEPSLIHLCYNSLDTRVFHPGPSRDQSSPVIGVVCALRPEKGLPTLLDAFAQILPERPTARLLLVGSGPCLGDLQAQAARLGITDSCQFVPTNDDVPDWLRSIDIFVLPSLREALSNSLMEAMASGCCVLASNVGGNPELVGKSEGGLLFEPGNASDLAEKLRIVLASHDLRESFATAAQKFILENFSSASSISRMQEIYRTILH
jgi:glycosyltransferase involved in cell wall biosynthesis